MLPPGNHASHLTMHLNYPLRPTLLIRDTISARAQFSGRQSPGQNLPRAPRPCQAVSAPDIPLDRKQLEKLQAALVQGRKRISVRGSFPLIPAGPTGSSQSGCPCRAQVCKMYGAFMARSFHVQVKQLCKEVQLDRADVLQWLKHYESAEPR